MTEGGRNLAFRGAVIAVAVVVGLVAWLVTRGDDDSSPPAQETERVVSESELVDAAAALTQPVYWAGPVSGTELELVESPGGVQVRYVAEGAEPGESLTIGSYPLENPSAAIQALAEEPGAIVRTAPDGRTIASSEGTPTSVYFASPDGSVQVEVYDPSPQRAMSLALSARVEPVR